MKKMEKSLINDENGGGSTCSGQEIVILVNRKKKATSRAELETFTRDELIDRVLQLQAHNNQLINLLKKEQFARNNEKDEGVIGGIGGNGGSSSTGVDIIDPREQAKQTKISMQRKFHFHTSYKRHILLKFYYLGWDYQGFTTQEHTNKTIEHHLFSSLIKVCLIEKREISNYHRCGRTDKGVSAFSQVISIDVRSKFAPEQQFTDFALENEINYCEALNRVLPANIKCTSWAPVKSVDYSARFDCKKRTYRYFFPRGDMNVDAMQQAAQHLIGEHDFRNLCKMDVANGVVVFQRDIRQANIYLANKSLDDPAYDMFYLELVGKAYLWHQVRCIMAILLLVGQGHESPDIIKELLDIEKNPCTPQYSMASDAALNLYNVEYKEACDYQNLDEYQPINWIHDELNLRRVITILQGQWAINSVQTTMMQTMLLDLQKIYEEKLNYPKLNTQIQCLLEGVRSKTYQPLMTRTKCESLENRIAHFAKKRRIEIQIPSSDGVTGCGDGGDADDGNNIDKNDNINELEESL